MSRKGNCYDNAPMESFFSTLKSELVDWQQYQTRTEAKSSIFANIEGFYNRDRLHSSLGYLSRMSLNDAFTTCLSYLSIKLEETHSS
jgi:putative transposase